ncbi:hypothetical protein [Methanosalsum natronophilum]|nr:hypothetical protein [Methanosalsum natronophilum]
MDDLISLIRAEFESFFQGKCQMLWGEDCHCHQDGEEIFQFSVRKKQE